MLDEQQVSCPYCGEQITVFIDVSQGNHETIEDCFVCCRPIEFLIESDGNEVQRLVVGSGDDVLN
jgi:transcription elongation factor Elf1